MGQQIEYSGMDKYPGWIATIITIVIGGIFLGALYSTSNSHHGDDHHEAASH
jgi:hypothetical protein